MTANHQEKNARVLERAGAAAVLMLETRTAGGDRLYDTVQRLLAAPAELDENAEGSAAKWPSVTPTSVIYETLCALVKQK